MADFSAALPIDILITSTSLDEQENGTALFAGQLYSKNDGYYLRYEETSSGNKSIQNTLKIEGHNCTIIRNGAVRMHQRYEQGKTTRGMYHTPHGSFLMETHTELCQFAYQEKPLQGELRLRYHLKLNEQSVGLMQVDLSVRARSSAV